MDQSYYCSKCKAIHRKGSNVYERHRKPMNIVRKVKTISAYESKYGKFKYETGKETPKRVADWAMLKYGKKAYYMLTETHEGNEVWGVKLTKQAARIVKEKTIRKEAKIRKGWIVKSHDYGVSGSMVEVKGLTKAEMIIVAKAERKLAKSMDPNYPGEYDDSIEGKRFEKQIFGKLKKYIPAQRWRNLIEAAFWVEDDIFWMDSGG